VEKGKTAPIFGAETRESARAIEAHRAAVKKSGPKAALGAWFAIPYLFAELGLKLRRDECSKHLHSVAIAMV
jgi:hypothetical protein